MGNDQFQQVEQRQRSVGAMLVAQAATSADREAFRHRDASGRWVSLSWRETREVVFEIAAGLLSLGLEAEERVAIASSTRVEWILADLGVMCAGGATTTVYPSTKDEDVSYILRDSESRVVIVEDAEQLAKVAKHLDRLDRVVAVVVIDGEADGDVPAEKVMTFDDLRRRGRAHLEASPDAVTGAVDATGPDSLSTLIYTSGTTGRPKGVRLVHDCWAYEGRAVEVFELLHPDDLQYLWLPLSHVFGKALIALQLQIGFATAVDGNIDRIVDGLGEVRPTFMCGAPRIFEKVRARVMTGNASGLKAQIARWAFHVGLQTVEPRLRGQKLSPLLAAQYALADRLVFAKLKERMGGNIRFFVSGSAKLNAQVQRWFYAAGLLIIEGYGMTETSAVSCVNLPDQPRLGTVGPAIPGTELKIAEDGEVLVRGGGVARGYHNVAANGLEEEQAECFVDGWFHTGDIGELDADGFLKITDRKKDLIKTSGGKYVAPQKVEGALVANCPYVDQVIVQGEGRKYISALLALDADAVTAWAEAQGEATDDYARLVESEAVRTLIDGYVEKANGRLERWETVKRYAILPQPLSVETGEMTPSMKIRRQAVAANHSDLLDSLYDAE